MMHAATDAEFDVADKIIAFKKSPTTGATSRRDRALTLVGDGLIAESA